MGGRGNAKLSRERKHRMREHATQKLSKAYHLDEIACSVATMQSASTLEDVAQLVLQRNPNNSDAKYVHFFHEKIPSRQLAECTSLQPLDEIIADRPMNGELLRTRAVTRMFKEDFVGAAKDLTEALAVCRYYQGRHKAGREELQLASAARDADTQRNTRWKEEVKFEEEDHPNSLETQLLFQRAGVYLTIACQHINAALPPKGAKTRNGANSISHTELISNADGNASNVATNGCLGAKASYDCTEPTLDPPSAENEINRQRLAARKIVKTNAKRALRDYVTYLSHFDYSPGLPAVITEGFVCKVNQTINGSKSSPPLNSSKVLQMEGNSALRNGQLSDTLVPHQTLKTQHHTHPSSASASDSPTLPQPGIHKISTLFSAGAPTDLPAEPLPNASLISTKAPHLTQASPAAQQLLAQTDAHEALTYHPLLTDALHSLLLCHVLCQTSIKELQRHAHMVARLARICDGYPIFQAARSPSRADWIEVLRRSSNFLDLSGSWESLCAPAPLQGSCQTGAQKESEESRRERLRQAAVMEALEDERVCDEDSFHAAVRARQKRQAEEEFGARGGARRWAQDDGQEYPIGTERAQALVRWMTEAESGGDGALRRKKKSTRSRVKSSGNELARNMESLRVDEGRVHDEVG